jgi:hypothetical protein
MKRRLVFRKTKEGELEQSFHVAWPGREFSCMSTNYLNRNN